MRLISSVVVLRFRYIKKHAQAELEAASLKLIPFTPSRLLKLPTTPRYLESVQGASALMALLFFCKEDDRAFTLPHNHDSRL